MTRVVWHPDRVKKVDSVGQNVLVRGCMPLVGDPWRFAYDELIEASGVPLGGYEVHDISLIDCVGERYMLEPEMDAFGLAAPPSSYWPPYQQENWRPWTPNSGALRTEEGPVPATFYWWPIEGLAEGLAEGGDQDTFLFSPGWNLSGLVDLVTNLMADQSGVPKAVYAHCTLGADRTGALHTSYLVRKGMSLDSAIAKADSSTSAGAPAEDYRRLRAAYADYRGPSSGRP